MADIKQDSNETDLTEANCCAQRTVLLVDDDTKLLRALQRAMVEQDYRVVTAISAAEALAIIPNQNIDLILSDNLMAGTLGTEFLSEIRERFPQIILMMLSGYLPETTANRLKDEIGIARILNKPCDAANIVRAIKEELELVTSD